MMRVLFTLLFLSLSLSACGVKGKLKSPSEIQRIQEKEAGRGEKPAPEEKQPLPPSNSGV